MMMIISNLILSHLIDHDGTISNGCIVSLATAHHGWNAECDRKNVEIAIVFPEINERRCWNLRRVQSKTSELTSLSEVQLDRRGK